MFLEEKDGGKIGEEHPLTQLVLFNLTITSLIVRVLLSPIDGYYIDVGCFNSWFYAASEFGVREFYRKVWCDYPPFNVFIFWVFGNLAKHLSLFGTPSTIYVVKLPSNLFDLATSYILFRYLKGKLGDGWALTAATFYLFNPSTIFNSSVWGQFDAVYTFFIVLSLTAILDLKVKLSLMSYALAVLSKPQAIAFFPVLAMFVLFKLDLKRILTAVVSFISTFLVFILPFEWCNPVDFVLNLYLGGYGEYKYTSLNAFNLWGLVGINMQDTPHYHFVGWVLFGVALVFILYYTKVYSRNFNDSSMVYSTFLTFFSFFMFLTRMHERYLFPAVALCVMSLAYSKKLVWISVTVTFTSLLNQAYALKFLNEGMFIPQSDLLVYVVSALNLFTLLCCYYLLVKREETFIERRNEE